jgi:class 3 adenylate cyclase
MQSKIKYAKSGDISIAYRVVGDGPRDLVFSPGAWSHLELAWEEPLYVRYAERLASFSRLIIFDKRGTGLSDRFGGLPTLEERMDDIRAVLDAVGSKSAALMGNSEGGPMSALFAATYPDRTSALVLYGAYARTLRDHDYPCGHPPKGWAAFIETAEKTLGEPTMMNFFAPSRAADEAFNQRACKLQRAAVSPGAVAALLRSSSDVDVRAQLPAIRVPTLVLHRTGDLVVNVEMGRYLAQHIPGARLVELPGVDHFPWVGDQDRIVDEVEEFLTGVRHGAEPDRVLATVLFSDIVGSTERAARLGDRQWREMLDNYYSVVRKELSLFRGREINHAGDGFLATFDGPARAVRCACAIRDEIRGLGLELRCGLHTGECELIGDDIGGIAVHIGARVASTAGPGEVLVSSTVKDLVAGSALRFIDRGGHSLKGVPGEWRLFLVQ